MEQKQIDITEAWGTIRPNIVALIVTRDSSGKANIMPAGWTMHTSKNPQLIAISIGKTRHTHKILEETEDFVVAIANKELQETIEKTGNCSGANKDKFKEFNIETEEAELVNPPLIKKATINFECKKTDKLDTGDHTIFIGKILRATHRENQKPLFYFGKGKFK